MKEIFQKRLSLLLRTGIAIVFIQTLYYKFSAHPDSVRIFSELGLEPYGRIGLGIVELLTSILLFVPITRAWALLISLGIICGALVSHVMVIGTEVNGDGGLLFALACVVLVLTLIASALHRAEIVALVKALGRVSQIKVTTLIFVLSGFISGCAQDSSSVRISALVKSDSIAARDSLKYLTPAQWKQRLTAEQYYVLRNKGTEQAFTGEFVFTKDKGVYKCAGCGEHLFTDDMKFESHCGWPSFDRELAGGKINQTEDNSHGMHRIEITCARCGGHLGHLFDDGPTETGERYCVNSAALSFEPEGSEGQRDDEEIITLGGGCFWCIEAVFEQLKGVTKVESGYSGGTKVRPTYTEVCTGQTGHAEVVQITYRPKEISFAQILEVFFTLHDPTSINRQGADVGSQYRSAIFYHNSLQRAEAEKAISAIDKAHVYGSKIVTEVQPASDFYPAENYHQEYYALHREEPYCKAVIQPKMEKLHQLFIDQLK